MTNLDVVSLRSDVTLSKSPGPIWKIFSVLDSPIDLVLIGPQSVGKRTHDLMDTVNAKK
jgi:hypothetical protein